MKIVVTGGNGRIGRYVVRGLVEAGHRVTSVDIRRHLSAAGPGRQADLTDAGQVYGALAGAEAVVHMGAWANAGMVAHTQTYGDNVQSTYNVFQACADLGIRRVISASSNQVYGLAGAPPEYLPVDEEHPLRPINCYALSKVAGEQAAEYFCRLGDIEILSFRILGTRAPAELPGDIEAVVADPSRGGRLLWTRTDARDVALACRLAAEAESVEAGPYNIAGPRVVLERPVRDLVAEYFGTRIHIGDGLQGVDSPFSCQRARRVFGYVPRYPWAVGQYHAEEELPEE